MTDIKSTLGRQSINLDDLEKAENSIIHLTQKQCFSEDMTALQMATGVKKTSNLYKLDPVLKAGVIRVGGRLTRAAMPEEVKFPVILPKNSHISTLILRYFH